MSWQSPHIAKCTRHGEHEDPPGVGGCDAPTLHVPLHLLRSEFQQKKKSLGVPVMGMMFADGNGFDWGPGMVDTWTPTTIEVPR